MNYCNCFSCGKQTRIVSFESSENGSKQAIVWRHANLAVSEFQQLHTCGHCSKEWLNDFLMISAQRSQWESLVKTCSQPGKNFFQLCGNDYAMSGVEWSSAVPFAGIHSKSAVRLRPAHCYSRDGLCKDLMPWSGGHLYEEGEQNVPVEKEKEIASF